MKAVLVNQRQVMPSKVVCVGRNYVEHIQELCNEIPEEMVVFVKPNSAISDNLLSTHGEQLHYEGELCFMFEAGTFNAVGFGLDLTKRFLQTRLKAKGLPWERAKAFDGSVVFSPFVRFEKSVDLSFILEINGTQQQRADQSLMMYKPDEILAEISTFMTLADGDIVMTGTPQGVGRVNPGDLFEGKVFESGQLLTSKKWTAEKTG